MTYQATSDSGIEVRRSTRYKASRTRQRTIGQAAQRVACLRARAGQTDALSALYAPRMTTPEPTALTWIVNSAAWPCSQSAPQTSADVAKSWDLEFFDAQMIEFHA